MFWGYHHLRKHPYSWWLNQPIWKIWSSKLDHETPSNGVKINNIWVATNQKWCVLPCFYQTIGDFLRFHVSFFRGTLVFQNPTICQNCFQLKRPIFIKKTDIMINFFPFQLTKYSDCAGFSCAKITAVHKLSTSEAACFHALAASFPLISWIFAELIDPTTLEVGLSLHFSWGINPQKLTWQWKTPSFNRK